ncbi:ABC transporter permease [Leifsonia sp. 21MFCrub1.1]|uniref:ABC transporter permease n=1 Tax=Leifsonia sp. 21MFCrub1.1 TaxID=1798223 RepID=UPI0008928225|nr:ABC transporter permease [Leifsonia sp. 21MFCrub1.1]SEB04230.1 ABC-2 type transport system permease protein [Leifsonia sp. 21MFCrub1.1]
MRRTPLHVVTRFELARTLRKPLFWVSALLLPGIMAAMVIVVAWAGNSQPDKTKPITFEYSDQSGLISETAASHLGGTPARADAVERVKSGQLTAFFDFPADPIRQPVTIVAADRGIMSNPEYSKRAIDLFAASVDESLGSTEVVQLVRTIPLTEVQTYSDGEPAAGLGAMIPPGLLAVLLLLIVSLLGNQMLNSTVEEKENRVSEMLLVSMPARVLINGKVLALALVGLIQLGIVAVASIILYAIASSWADLDALGIGDLTVDPIRIAVGLLLLTGGALTMTALLVLIGAAMPTAKDAAPYYTGVVILTMAPLYLISTILINPSSPVVQMLTYFPFTSPMTSLLLNATGALHPMIGAVIGIGLLLLGILILKLAIAVFQRGVIQYDQPLRLTDLKSTRA